MLNGSKWPVKPEPYEPYHFRKGAKCVTSVELVQNLAQFEVFFYIPLSPYIVYH